ncbi:Cysteine hydrolase [Mycena venus]|uniref:Cysteine hydrolase n=1 Tax=Mycena venus TaxID=2733690 RepID=A0A8H7CPM8_9AGAR|nr:Cysteine hydrolase [Mycena venus]
MSSSAHLASGLPNTALVVIDVQQAFLEPHYLKRERSTPKLETNIAGLLATFRANKLPIFHIHHVNTKNENSFFYEKTRPTNVLPMDFVAPNDGEPVLRKYDKSSGFGAFLVSDGTTDLSDVLNAQGIKTLILVGISSPHCVGSTARSAGDRGFSVIVIGDATATYAAGVVEFGGSKGDSEDGNSWGAETVHGVAMAHLQGELADVVTTAEVLRHL